MLKESPDRVPIKGEVALWERQRDLITAADVANIHRHYKEHGLEVPDVYMGNLLHRYREYGVHLMHKLPTQYPGGRDPLETSDEEEDNQYL